MWVSQPGPGRLVLKYKDSLGRAVPVSRSCSVLFWLCSVQLILSLLPITLPAPLLPTQPGTDPCSVPPPPETADGYDSHHLTPSHRTGSSVGHSSGTGHVSFSNK